MPSRIWLDATDPDGPRPMRHDSKSPVAKASASSSSVHPPPLPALPASFAGRPLIPPRHSPSLPQSHSSLHHQSHAQGRRRSLPAKQPRRRPDRSAAYSPSRGPEVISTLIDSLSNISFPDPTEAERPPGQASPDRTHPVVRHGRSFDGGSDMNFLAHRAPASPPTRSYGAFRQALEGQLQGIDDAAEPPVVRTTKPPSSFYQLGPAKTDRAGSLSFGALGYAAITTTHSNPSLTSLRSNDDSGAAVASPIARHRHGSLTTASNESLKHHMDVKKLHRQSASINGRNSSKQAGRADMGGLLISTSASTSPATAASAFSASSTQVLSTVVNDLPYPAFQEPILEDDVIPEEPEPPISSKKEGKRPAKSPALPASPALSGPSVPDRRSSLRHQDILPSDLPTTPEASPEPAKSPRFKGKEPKTLTSYDLLNGEDTEVTKRIKELKAKKEQRDREARQSLTADDELRSSVGSSLTNGDSARRAKKVPRDIRLPSGPHTPAGHGNESEYLSALLQQPSPPLTPTPLPINYSYVVKSLDQDRPSSQSGSAESSDASPRRASIAIGTLPSAKPISKALLGSKKEAAKPDAERRSPDAKAQPDASLRSNSLTTKRKRWSQPDLTGGVERRSSIKAADALAGKRALNKDPVPEERPSSADSIERGVETFIHAQRLSQKIRHPQTGRVISFSEVGNPKGNVVFCCVGMGLTRYITAFYDELASTLNLRLITPDRPGVGDSQVDANGTPLSWSGKISPALHDSADPPDDVMLICHALGINKFSLIAHSAGAIYALATALRIPQHIRGKVHLLAPWIPPSQMEAIGSRQDHPPPSTQLPKSQRFLRALPAPFLKVANSSFLSATSASLSPNLGSPAGAAARRKRKSLQGGGRRSDSGEAARPATSADDGSPLRPPPRRGDTEPGRESLMYMDRQNIPSAGSATSLARANSSANMRAAAAVAAAGPLLRPPPSALAAHQRSASAPFHAPSPEPPRAEDPARRRAYDERLTLAIWSAATTNANPATDLLVCLERTRGIGFRYVDITRAVVMHHGARDTRVPIDNVRWLAGLMKRCEVRVLEGEGHGLMASAAVMGGVLTEMAREWDEWVKVVSKGRASD
jgi:pimeloyl-ACP methyl ester carboxylesterase